MKITRRSLLGSLLTVPILCKIEPKRFPKTTISTKSPSINHSRSPSPSPSFVEQSISSTDLDVYDFSLVRTVYKSTVDFSSFKQFKMGQKLEIRNGNFSFSGVITSLEVTTSHQNLTIYKVHAEGK
jgi:hypothetical protein